MLSLLSLLSSNTNNITTAKQQNRTTARTYLTLTYTVRRSSPHRFKELKKQQRTTTDTEKHLIPKMLLCLVCTVRACDTSKKLAGCFVHSKAVKCLYNIHIHTLYHSFCVSPVLNAPRTIVSIRGFFHRIKCVVCFVVYLPPKWSIHIIFTVLIFSWTYFCWCFFSFKFWIKNYMLYQKLLICRQQQRNRFTELQRNRFFSSLLSRTKHNEINSSERKEVVVWKYIFS